MALPKKLRRRFDFVLVSLDGEESSFDTLPAMGRLPNKLRRRGGAAFPFFFSVSEAALSTTPVEPRRLIRSHDEDVLEAAGSAAVDGGVGLSPSAPSPQLLWNWLCAKDFRKSCRGIVGLWK